MKFKWIVEFTVDETWVADGFNMTADRAKEMLHRDLGYAYSCELAAKIIASPDEDKIAKCQGYTGASDPAFKND